MVGLFKRIKERIEKRRAFKEVMVSAGTHLALRPKTVSEYLSLLKRDSEKINDHLVYLRTQAARKLKSEKDQIIKESGEEFYSNILEYFSDKKD